MRKLFKGGNYMRKYGIQIIYKESNLKFKLFCKESNLKGQNIEI